MSVRNILLGSLVLFFVAIVAFWAGARLQVFRSRFAAGPGNGVNRRPVFQQQFIGRRSNMPMMGKRMSGLSGTVSTLNGNQITITIPNNLIATASANLKVGSSVQILPSWSVTAQQ